MDNKQSNSDVTKFIHLKNALRGPAFAAVQGLQLTDSKYRHAVEILRNRFGKKQVVIAEHMKKHQNIEPAKTDDVQKIRKVFDTLEIHT